MESAATNVSESPILKSQRMLLMGTDENTTALCEETFAKIYRDGAWNQRDANVRSGEGSSPSRNRPYIQLLQQFMRDNNIRSVVDVGCGDWSFSKFIDWTGIDYTGIDIVPDLIANHQANFARPGIRFLHDNFAECDLPKADLVICKEALQHLPNSLIRQFIQKLHSFRFAILTNDRVKYEPRNWKRFWKLVETSTVPNSDIEIGGWRTLQLREAPFHLPMRELARFRMWHSNGIHIKEVLLWTNPKNVDA